MEIHGGRPLPEEDRVATPICHAMVLWTHRNEVVFRGRTPSADAVVHEVGGLVNSWNRVGLSLPVFVTL